MICELCKREVCEITKHHLVPKGTRKKKLISKKFDKNYFEKTIWVCCLCHQQLHKFYTEIELAKDFWSLELILADEKICKFLEWAKKQHPKTHPWMCVRRKEK